MNQSVEQSFRKVVEFFTARKFLGLLTLLILGGLIILLGFLSYKISPFWIFAGLGAIALAFVIFRNPWHGLYLLAFFLPFERLGSYDIAGVTVRPSQITALLTLASVTLYFLGKRKFPLPKNPTIIPLALFAIVGMMGLVNAPNLQRSVMVFAFVIFTIFISIMVPFLLQKKLNVEILFKFLFGAMFLVTIFGLYQFAGDLIGLPPELTGLRELYTKDVLGFPRVQSTALEPLYYANYLLVPLSVLLSMFLARDKSLPSIYVIGLLSLGIVNLVLTVARGGYIAFTASAGLLLAYYFFQLKLFSWRNFFYTTLGVVMAGIVIIQFVGLATVSDQFVTHVGNLFEGASYSERVEMFEVAWQAWDEHRLIGIGSGSFGPYQSWHPYIVPEHGWSIVNNEYLELLAENGVFGLLAIVTTFLIVIVRSIKALIVAKDEYLKLILVGVLAGFIGILVQYNTFSVLYIVHIWFTIGLLIALQNLIFKREEK